MASVTLQINDPTLTGLQVFKVRYRLLPAGAWIPIADQTNAAFTVTGLAAGTYQFEFVVQLTDGSLCPAVYKTVTVTEPADTFLCPTFTVTMGKNPNVLNISYTLPLGYTAPACGYKIKYKLPLNAGYAYATYATLPTSPFKLLIPSAIAMDVTIVADLCGGGTIQCFNGDITPPADPACTPMSAFGFNVTILDWGNQDYFRLIITATQSSPATTAASITVTQINTIAPAVPWTTSVVTNSSPTPFTYTMYIYHNNPVPSVSQPAAGTRSWNVSIIDICGKSHFFTITN
jgi:hypothetical protein